MRFPAELCQVVFLPISCPPIAPAAFDAVFPIDRVPSVICSTLFSLRTPDRNSACSLAAGLDLLQMLGNRSGAKADAGRYAHMVEKGLVPGEAAKFTLDGDVP